MGILDTLLGKSNNKLKTYIEKDSVLLDVRTKKEFNQNHINSSINIPLQELNGRINEIAKLNRPIVVYCASGVRSAMAVQILTQNRLDVINGGSISKLRKAISH